VVFTSLYPLSFFAPAKSITCATCKHLASHAPPLNLWTN